jgi:predicted TIM-barrel fold metal-dependent hydrolase
MPRSDKITIVSADSHGGLRPEEYRPYLDPEYRDYADVLRTEQDRWFGIIEPIVKPFDPELLAIIDPHGMIAKGAYRGAWDMEKRLEVFDAEGIAGAVVIFAAQEAMCPLFGSMNEPHPVDVRAAMARAYNRWLADFCAASDGRMAGLMGAVPFPDMGSLVAELRRGKEAGLGGVMMPELAGHDPDEPPLADPSWEPFWATCAELGFALCIHAGHGMAQGEFTKVLAATVAAFTDETGRLNNNLATSDGMMLGEDAAADAGARAFSTRDIATRRPLWELMWSGVFDRHPSLQICFTEVRTDWVPSTLAALDAIHAQGDTPLQMRPSEYWARNCSVGASSLRPSELAQRHEIGVDRMMFGTDFPHPEGTFPNTPDWIRVTFDGVPEDEARRIIGENAIDIYGFDREKLHTVAERVGPSAESLFGRGADIDERIVDHWNRRSGYDKPAERIDVSSWQVEIDNDIRQLELEHAS